MKLISRPRYYRKLKQGGSGFKNLFAGYSIVQSTPITYKNTLAEDEDDDYFFTNPITLPSSKAQEYEVPELSSDLDQEDYYYQYEEDPITEEAPEVIGSFNSSELLGIDIEDLLKSEGITSINGKKIKFGNKNLRSSNARYGVKNSNHKKRDPHTGNASARDISIINGNPQDYAEFRRVLMSNPRVVAWMQAKNWGIINELTPAVLRRTNGTGPHFHFGPDRWARKVWGAWLNNPNLPVTQVI